MNDQITLYLESLVSNVLSHPSFTSLPDDQKQQAAEKVRNHLNEAILDLTVDNLTDEQVMKVKNLPVDSAEMEEKIEQYSAQIPNFAQMIEAKLNEEVEAIKQNPSLVN